MGHDRVPARYPRAAGAWTDKTVPHTFSPPGAVPGAAGMGAAAGGLEERR